MLELLVTRDDTNSESALVAEWLVEDEQAIRGGQAVCVVETSKASIELEAPGEGTIVQLVHAGDEVELGRAIALIAQAEDELPQLRARRDEAQKKADEATAVPAGQANATRRAIELAAEYGIDLASIETTGFITAEDVERHARARTAAEPGGSPILTGLTTSGVTLPDTLSLDDSAGVLEPEFLASLRADPGAFQELSSDEKSALYREHGAVVGDDVVFGEGTIVVAPRIVIGAGTRFGPASSVTCDEVFAVGPLGLFGPRLEVRCRRAFFGATAYVGRDVRIGGGGARDPWGTFVAGDLLYLGDEAYINPCRPVVLGSEVYVTMRSMLVTHNIGHSVLEGFENRFDSIVLEDRAQIGLGTVVYAGARVGSEAIVASNSYVVSDIPAGKLAIGVPARVAGNAKRGLSPRQQWTLAQRMLDELAELLTLGGHEVLALEQNERRGIEIQVDGRRSVVLLVQRLDSELPAPEADGEAVVLALRLTADPPQGVAVLDLTGRRAYGEGGVLLESVREFCRKRGIRFGPEPWRYTGGLI